MFPARMPPLETQQRRQARPHLIAELASLFVSFSASLAWLRFSLALQRNPSRHTLGCADPRPLLPNRLVPTRLPYGARKNQTVRTLPPQTDVRAVQLPASAVFRPHSCPNGSCAPGASHIQRLRFRSCVKNPHHRLPQ